MRDIVSTSILFCVFFCCKVVFAGPYLVPSGSMKNTIQPGDVICADHMVYGLRIPFTHAKLTGGHIPQRGDVVLLDNPHDGRRLVKRLVAVGGDAVVMHGGVLVVNGSTEPLGDHVALLDHGCGHSPDYGPTTIPDGEALVVGDSRGCSLDGRYFGLVNIDDIYGKVVAVCWRRGLTWIGL